MISKSQVDEINTIISNHQSFLITTHHNPDGDAIGSEIAMADYIRHLGKDVYIINYSETPNNYKFLDPDNEIIVYNADNHRELAEAVDVYIILDISDWGRLREVGGIIKKSTAPKICIDHHYIEDDFADLDVIYKEASSTGELLYEYLNAVHYTLNLKAATALYTCILTDTGSFRFSNTSARAHKIVADLIRVGIKTKEIYSQVYEKNSRSKMALMGEALCGIHYEFDGYLAWFVLKKEMFEKHQASHWDTEGFPEIPRTIEGVEISLMFTELEENKVKISLRSKGKLIINTVAKKFGGGGHHFAAGAQFDKSLDETIPLVLAEIEKVIKGENSI